MSQPGTTPTVTDRVALPWSAEGGDPGADSPSEVSRLLSIIERVRRHDVTVARGAELLAMPQAAFMPLLGEHGVPVIDHRPDDLDLELRSLGGGVALRRLAPTHPECDLPLVPSTSETLAAVRASVAERDPELLAMVDDVDRTLIRAMLDRDPWVRVRMGLAMAATLAELATWRRPTSTP